jgi:L-ascorbate metabolism protein UlaG (beta-lactamase superfamily)
MNIKYIGHSAFRIEIGGSVVYIDPWITGNSMTSLKVEDIDDADFVLITHEHSDHGFEDAVKICKLSNAKLVAVFETANRAGDGVETLPGNTGGMMKLTDTLSVYFTLAYHSTEANQPVGYVLSSSEGTVYHAGDTALFGDMKYLGVKFNLDVALLPIGDVFTMGPEDAARAVEYLKPKKVAPMHYETFPLLTGTVEGFVKKVGNSSEVVRIAPGEDFSV